MSKLFAALSSTFYIIIAALSSTFYIIILISDLYLAKFFDKIVIFSSSQSRQVQCEIRPRAKFHIDLFEIVREKKKRINNIGVSCYIIISLKFVQEEIH